MPPTPDRNQDPRVYLAAERTFLAWIRTGLSLMGFGFVVARFGLFLREIEFSTHPLSLHSARFTLWVGTALILIGVLVNLFSALQHIRFVRAVKSGTEVVDRPVTMAVAIALILAVTGVAMTIYLVFVR
jgi:putative membrane protein